MRHSGHTRPGRSVTSRHVSWSSVKTKDTLGDILINTQAIAESRGKLHLFPLSLQAGVIIIFLRASAIQDKWSNISTDLTCDVIIDLQNPISHNVLKVHAS